MKKALGLIALMTLLLAVIPVVHAENALPGNAEFKGVQQIFSLIHNVSLRKSDLKTRETLTDVLEMKGELYANGGRSPAIAAQARPLRPARPMRKP